MKPHSLKKMLPDLELKPITILVDGSAQGIKKDAKGVIYIRAEDRKKQARYFAKTVKAAGKCPQYVSEHLDRVFSNGNSAYDIVVSVLSGNTQAEQVVGLITLLEGYLSGMKRVGKSIPIYIETPEAGLHPNVQSNLSDLLLRIQNKYQ